jgi:hypothetical protein
MKGDGLVSVRSVLSVATRLDGVGLVVVAGHARPLGLDRGHGDVA